MIREISESMFEQEVGYSTTPVVVDFWAAWCGPCKMLSPVIEELSEEMETKAKFIKVNVDENPTVSRKYNIASIPTVMVFKDGEVKANLVGFRPKELLKSEIEKYI
ncbi:thioredoxin-1 [Clostridium acetireducens DSM 10703]|uniref:Thioredoxin n=1 Tax=Clostridium acetireducens DSM 10703 TaxID=1121290 RepID=A0A1E8F0B4_9CLOT|nr:thioredoxin [Clostridium acetireducens]OFI06849.1 thioredoxin-1 [Clostridium acetireducens DSM 10703]